MALYTFDTTIAPPSGNWPTQSNASSNGTHWVLAGGVSASIDSGNVYPVDASNEFELNCVMNFPTTAASYNGISIGGATSGSISVDAHWERQGWYDVRVVSTYVFNSTIASGTDLTLRILITRFGIAIFMNGQQIYSGPNQIVGNLKVTFNKYTEATAALIKSGSIDSRAAPALPTPSSRSTGILSTLGVGK